MKKTLAALDSTSIEVIEVERVKSYLLNLQQEVCKALAEEDGEKTFELDSWVKPNMGEGYTRVLSEGKLIEKGAVNFSHVRGATLPPAASIQHPELAGTEFQAMGVSIVIHPRNPYVPTTHANVRFFIAEKPNQKPVWWFGGGFDLTPYYPFEEDCIAWHETAAKACDPFGKDIYPHFKAWADNYFYLKHRRESRGVGGLFFDDYSEVSFDHSFSLMRSIGDHFIKAYLPIVRKRKELPYSDRERSFQLYRRGRYVEFNLLYDRGTLFGLQSDGRVESILVSLPPLVQWQYNWQPEIGSEEEKLFEFLKPKDWLSIESIRLA